MLILDDEITIQWGPRVARTGRECLARIGGEVELADRLGSVPARSRLLCAGLSALALEVDRALRPASARLDGERERIADLAASLSVLTKIDDEVIDSLAFHGGPESSRAIVRRDSARFLAVSERSILEARPASCAPRALLAAAIGERIQSLATHADRAGELYDLIRQGWATQVDAVATFSAWPHAVSLREIDRVTRRVSGDWLAIVAACGALRSDRGLAQDEIEAIRDAGLFIQRADSLADLEKDQRAGLGATWAGLLTERVLPDEASLAERYRAAARVQLERLATPSRSERLSIRARLAGLGGLADALDWIHAMLLDRYRQHRLYRSPAAQEPQTCSAP